MRHLSHWVTAASGVRRALLIFSAFVMVGLAALIPLVANRTAAPREIVLIARDMAFYVEGSDVPNPTIVLSPTEEIRLVVRNQDPGIVHGLSTGLLRRTIDRIEAGKTEKIRMRAPSKPGRYEYVCPPHAQMMKGVLLVT